MTFGENLSDSLWFFPHLVHDLTYCTLTNPIFLGNINLGDFLHHDLVHYIQLLTYSQWP